MRARVRLYVDDDAEILGEAQIDGALELVDERPPLALRRRQERAGIDGQPDEIEARPAQPREIAWCWNRALRLERRPIVVPARRRKLARQLQPWKGVDPALQLQRRRRGGRGAGS